MSQTGQIEMDIFGLLFDNVTDHSNSTVNSSMTNTGPSKGPLIISPISVVLVLLIIPGNISVICYMWRKNKFSSNFNIYVTFLSMADVGVGLFVVPINIVQNYIPSLFGNVPACVSWKLVDYGLPSVSMLLLDAIALDRYRSVTSPLLYRTRFTKRRTLITSMSMWILGFIVWIPYFLALQFTGAHRTKVVGTCEIKFGYFTLGQAILAYHCPIVFLVGVYILLLYTLKKQSFVSESRPAGRRNIYMIENDETEITSDGGGSNISEVQVGSRGTATGMYITRKRTFPRHTCTAVIHSKISAVKARRWTFTTGSRSGRQLPGTQLGTYSIKSQRVAESDVTLHPITPQRTTPGEASQISARNLKCFKTLNMLVIIFLLCWVPFCILWPLKGIGWYIPEVIYMPSYLLVYINSAINPFIYVLTSKTIRTGVLKMFSARRPTT